MRKLRTLFYGMTHEHAPDKLETLKRLADKFDAGENRGKVVLTV